VRKHNLNTYAYVASEAKRGFQFNLKFGCYVEILHDISVRSVVKVGPASLLTYEEVCL
jgi:hypothetical protein